MNIIGITGPSGAGKSLLCVSLREKDIPCIDADEVYHSLLVPPSQCLDALREVFGDEVFCSDGSLERDSLATLVFKSPDKLELLNCTVLGFVLDKIRSIIREYGSRGYSTVAVDAPTLIESGFDKECDTVISVLASPRSRLARIMERDAISEEKAKECIKAQKSDDFYRESSDIVLQNDGDVEDFKKKIADLLSAEAFGSRGEESV